MTKRKETQKSDERQTTTRQWQQQVGARRPGPDVVCWKLMRLRRIWRRLSFFRLLLPCSSPIADEDDSSTQLSLIMMRQAAEPVCCYAIIYDVIHDTFHAECWREYEQQQIHRCTSSRVCTWCKSRRESHSQSSKSTMMSSRRRRCTSCIASLGVCARAITGKFIWIIQDLYTLQPVDFTSEWRPVHIDRDSV